MSADMEVQGRSRNLGAYVTMLVASGLGLLASLVLSVDAWKLAKDPNVKLSCNVNATINCGKVAVSWQSVILGFPNAFLGLMAESIVLTVAIAALTGVHFTRLFMRIAQLGMVAGIGFAFWMFYQSYFNIGALCPWCLVITFTTTLLFFVFLRINILDNNFGLSDARQASLTRALRLNADAGVVLIVWAVMAAMILFHYA